MVDEDGGGGRREGEEGRGGGKTDTEAGTAAVSKGRFHNVV
jgi:hypothetical protein